MTSQQMQYAYWQRLRQQALYRAYVAGSGTKPEVEEYKGLCFTAEEPNSTIVLQNIAGQYQTSVDGQNWADYALGNTINLSNVGSKVYFAAKTENSTCWNGSENPKFIMTGKIAASGNIQSLLDKECDRTDVPTKCYRRMFYNCTPLSKSPALPAITLNNECYSDMFFGCTSLIQAPELPAMSLGGWCYCSMFLSCTSLTETPELPATTLADGCYQYMFYECSSLTATSELPSKTMAPFCYDTMFKNCTSLTTAPILSSETLYDHCYANMFHGCTNLKISENDSSGSVVLDLKAETIEADAWNDGTFVGTGGSFIGDPSIGKIYRCYQ